MFSIVDFRKLNLCPEEGNNEQQEINELFMDAFTDQFFKILG